MSDADIRRGEGIALQWVAGAAREAAGEIAARATTRSSRAAVDALYALAEAIDPDAAAPAHPPPTPALRAAFEKYRRLPAAQAEEARACGYTGDECRECGSMRMVRNGTCLKCEVCGATTGCS